MGITDDHFEKTNVFGKNIKSMTKVQIIFVMY